MAQFPGGYSNLTYLLTFTGGSAPGAGAAHELVLRRPPFGAHIQGGHDMAREYRILSALYPTYGKVPRPWLYCEDETVIGAPFYVMERVRGLILRSRLPPGFPAAPEQLRQICQTFVKAMAELHTLDYRAAGLGDLGKPEGYTARQVAGWTRRYQNALTQDCPDFIPFASWLAAHLPESSPVAFIHNDFRFDNTILNPLDLSQIVAILDWELATIGDPLTDLGSTLAYWAESTDPVVLRRFGVSHLPGNFSRQELVEAYSAQSGLDTSQMLFYYLYGIFKNTVIALQIYARFKQGLTRDPRFEGLIEVIRANYDLAQRALDKQRISQLY